MKKGLYLDQKRKDLHEFVTKQLKVSSDYNLKTGNAHAPEYDGDNEGTSMGISTSK